MADIVATQREVAIHSYNRRDDILHTMIKVLEEAIKKVRELPEERQELAAKALELVLAHDEETRD